jgi:hypothetical protein
LAPTRLGDGVEYVGGCCSTRHTGIIFPYGNISRPPVSLPFFPPEARAASETLGRRGVERAPNLGRLVTGWIDTRLETY